MSDVQQVLAATGSATAIGTGVICDPVYIHYFTLNDLSIAAGIIAGLLTAILQTIKIYRTLKNKTTD